MHRKLVDAVVVVTGASRGLGAAVASGFAARGARVALLARSATQLEQVAQRLRATGGQAAAWPLDVRDWDAVHHVFGSILAHWGRLDILVNAAGLKHEGRIEQTSRQDAWDTLSVNYLGPLACCQAVIPAMRRQGAGHIINVSSVLGKRATPARGAYAASKAALNALTDALRVELMDTGIHVTLVCPGRFAEQDAGQRGLLAMSTERAAERIIHCVERPVRELVLTPAARVLSWLSVCAPGLVDHILRRARRQATAPPSSLQRVREGIQDE